MITVQIKIYWMICRSLAVAGKLMVHLGVARFDCFKPVILKIAFWGFWTATEVMRLKVKRGDKS